VIGPDESVAGRAAQSVRVPLAPRSGKAESKGKRYCSRSALLTAAARLGRIDAGSRGFEATYPLGEDEEHAIDRAGPADDGDAGRSCRSARREAAADLRGLIATGPRLPDHTMNVIPMYPFSVYEDMRLKSP